jgi:hypothetical protein
MASRESRPGSVANKLLHSIRNPGGSYIKIYLVNIQILLASGLASWSTCRMHHVQMAMVDRSWVS